MNNVQCLFTQPCYLHTYLKYLKYIFSGKFEFMIWIFSRCRKDESLFFFLFFFILKILVTHDCRLRFLQGLKTPQSLNHSFSICFGWWCYHVYCVIFHLYFVFQIQRLHFKSALYHLLLFPSRTDPVAQTHIIIWTNWLIFHCFSGKLMITVMLVFKT